MLSKPFKPLTIRKSLPSDEINDITPPAKRRKPSPPDDDRNTVKKTPTKTVTSPERSRASGDRLPLQRIRNPPSPIRDTHDRAVGAHGSETYYSILWRVPTNKKNKTWTDDGVLSIVGGYATLYNNLGKSIGRIPFSAPLLPGSNLTIGGKDVEVGFCIDRNDYLAVVKPIAAPTNTQKTKSEAQPVQPVAPRQPKLSLQSQMRAQILKEKMQAHKIETRQDSRVAAFKQPLRETTILLQCSGETPTPRHDPTAAGAVVFKRPKKPPQGRQTVDVVLDSLIGKQLRPHQKEGVKFLYECVMGLREFDGQGCILADDMGLGKTLTTIALVWTLLRQNPVYKDPPVVRKALIVCPVSLIRNWKREFRKWLGLDRLGVLEFDDQSTLLSNFDGKVYQVMIIGYERLRMVADDLAKGHPVDIVICDEGHRLKTMKNKNAQAIASLNTRRRIILSGTPIQNDLGEFFSMVNFVNDGCLGSQKGFIRDFEKPIMRSRQPDASEEEVKRGRDASEELARATSPFILRRTADILAAFLPPKTEYVLFCNPTKAQAKIYRNVLQSPMFHSALRSNETAFQLITILKKLCNSPVLMDPKYGNDDSTPSSSLATLNRMLPEGLSKLYQNSVSSKIRLLDELLQQIRHNTDEKVVVVSNYTSTLNLIEQLAINSNLSYLRLDGTVAAKKRQGLVDQFNRTKSAQSFMFLLSAKAGGVGLNLIGASRLVLFDVDWNPATDDQAVARIHRQGQKRHCRIYRFLIKGGLEEKIWQRQVVKRALADSIMQSGPVTSSGLFEPGGKSKGNSSTFSQEELKDLFRLDEANGLRTHDLIGCHCRGAGSEEDNQDKSLVSAEDTFPVEIVDPSDQDSCDQDSGGEFPELSAIVAGHSHTVNALKSAGLEMKKRKDPKLSLVNIDVETERQELMQYTHLDTSIISKAEANKDLTDRILSAVNDPCLEHVLRLGHDIMGGGGISYIFAKTKGSQTL